MSQVATSSDTVTSVLRLGVDIGGTFTDCVLADLTAGTLQIAKVPTTPRDQSTGFLRGLASLRVSLDAVESITHGTTIGTNAILERKGARCGLITTRGFRDVLELGRRTRPRAYGMTGSFEALIPRELRLEVAERVDAEGTVLEPLDESGVEAAARELLRLGAEAVVIHFLHAYINPAHERRAAELVRRLWPNDYVTTGSEVLPEFREFERGTTAALNAMLQPVMSRYLGRLVDELGSERFASNLLVMQGNGGMMAAGIAGRHAVQTVMSGPAAGAIAAAETARQAGFRHAIGCDMGGTSFDVSLIRDGVPAITSEKELRYAVPVRVPLIDIHTIGAGGGSIARVNRAGILQVGPESAGAEPGPLCYGRGGSEPTVTDAHVVLGRLPARALTGVTTDVDIEAVRRVLVERVGRPLGLDVEQAAAAVLAVVNNQLAGAIRMVSIEKGHDPRDFALVAFGGAGPLHATALARELGIPTVLVPRFPGITSALGCVLADVRHDFVQTLNRPLAEVNGVEVDAILHDQARQGRELLAREGVRVERVDVTHEADLLYHGQTHVLRIPITSPGFDSSCALDAFTARYREQFDIELPEMRAMLINVRTTVTGRRPPLDLRRLAPPAQATGDPLIETRRVYFDGRWLDTAVYDRERLPVGFRIAGPAIVEQLDATTVIDSGAEARVDEMGNLVIDIGRTMLSL
jgi:N-methylhydantoinase A